MINYSFLLLGLLILEILYFKIAAHFQILDSPNDRSSHNNLTIRGGGIIFVIAAIFFFLWYGFQFPYFFMGLFLISFISFLDDIHNLNKKIRLMIQSVSVLLLFFQLELFNLSWYWLIIASIFVIGTINAYNFMDGINGITGSYSFLTILSLFYINNEVISFTSNDFLIVIGLSLFVFGIFNFRTKAKCFAGDVGSVSIVFILIFLIGQLILKTNNFTYIFLLLCYGLDVAFTVFFRKIRGEEIFKAHRTHFYQFLANEKQIPHLVVSGLYFFAQLIINLIFIFCIRESQFLALLLIGVISALFLALRLIIEGRTRLLKV